MSDMWMSLAVWDLHIWKHLLIFSWKASQEKFFTVKYQFAICASPFGHAQQNTSQTWMQANWSKNYC